MNQSEMSYFDMMELEGQTNIWDFMVREQLEMKFEEEKNEDN